MSTTGKKGRIWGADSLPQLRLIIANKQPKALGESQDKLAARHLRRASRLAGARRFDEALAAIDQAIKLARDDSEYHGARGVVLRNLKRFDEALAAADRAIELAPNDGRWHGARGEVLRNLGQFEEALAAFDRGIELAPDESECHGFRAYLLRTLERFDEALAAADRAIELAPNDSRWYGARGLVLRDVGREYEAITAFSLMFSNSIDILPLDESNNSPYRHDTPSFQTAVILQQSEMGELTEDELIAHFRNASKATRLAVSRLLSATAGEMTGRLKTELRAVSRRARHEARAAKDWRPPSLTLPSGLRWPREQYNKSPEYSTRDGIIHHLERVWKPIIASGAIDMALLRSFYPSTARAIDTYKNNDGKEPRALPSDLDIRLVSPGSGRRRKSAALPRVRIT